MHTNEQLLHVYSLLGPAYVGLIKGFCVCVFMTQGQFVSFVILVNCLLFVLSWQYQCKWLPGKTSILCVVQDAKTLLTHSLTHTEYGTKLLHCRHRNYSTIRSDYPTRRQPTSMPNDNDGREFNILTGQGAVANTCQLATWQAIDAARDDGPPQIRLSQTTHAATNRCQHFKRIFVQRPVTVAISTVLPVELRKYLHRGWETGLKTYVLRVFNQHHKNPQKSKL